MKLTTLLLIAIFAAAGCNKSDKSSSSDDGPGDKGPGDEDPNKDNINVDTEVFEASKLEFKAIEPPVAENTPASIASGTLAVSDGLSLVDQPARALNCDSEIEDNVIARMDGTTKVMCKDIDPDEPKADQVFCNIVTTLKCRYFMRGEPAPADPATEVWKGFPDGIYTALTNVDQEIQGLKQVADGTYVPCADPTNTEGKSGTEEDSSSFAPYALVDYSPSYTFKDRLGADQAFDPKFTAKFSCYNWEEDEKFWTAFGETKNEAGKTIQYIGTARPENGGGRLAMIDEDKNVETWFTIGDKAEKYSDAEGTTAIMHLKSSPSTKTLEFTGTGVGLGNGCGFHIMTNGKFLFSITNSNQTRTCNAKEEADNLAQSPASNPYEYQVDLDGVETCVNVEGDYPQRAALTDCTEAGLTKDSFTMPSLSRSVIEAINAPLVFAEELTGIPKFQMIPIENEGEAGDDKVTVPGAEEAPAK
jgi:hypothetical protein